MLAAPYNPREIDIAFNDWSIRGIETGRKKCTSRNEAHGVPGDYFFVNGKKYVLEEVFARRLGYVVEYLWMDEGATSPAEFIEVWTKIYGPHSKNYVLKVNKIVYVHYFKPNEALP